MESGCRDLQLEEFGCAGGEGGKRHFDCDECMGICNFSARVASFRIDCAIDCLEFDRRMEKEMCSVWTVEIVGRECYTIINGHDLDKSHG